MKVLARNSKMFIRVPIEFHEVLNIVRSKESNSDFIISLVVKYARTDCYCFPINKLDLLDKLEDTDTKKRRTEIKRIQSKKKNI